MLFAAAFAVLVEELAPHQAGGVVRDAPEPLFLALAQFLAVNRFRYLGLGFALLFALVWLLLLPHSLALLLLSGLIPLAGIFRLGLLLLTLLIIRLPGRLLTLLAILALLALALLLLALAL